MEKEKQIEEMIKAMSVYIPTPDDEIRAKLLYAAGYGNVKEAVKEFAERVKGIFSGNAEERQKGYAKEIGCFLTVGEFNEEIDELIKEVCSETADALIAAGIGDVKAAEHRAEVAEKALERTVVELLITQGYSALSAVIRAQEFFIPEAIKEAEKELEEAEEE